MKYILGDCNLPKLLKEIGWINQDLADRLDMSRQQVSDYCTGVKKMSTATLFSVADTMGVDPRRIYVLIPVPTKSKAPKGRVQSKKKTE